MCGKTSSDRQYHPDKNKGNKEAEQKFVDIAAGRLLCEQDASRGGGNAA